MPLVDLLMGKGTWIGITFNSFELHNFVLQRRGVSLNTLLLEYLYKASDWSKINMGYAEGCDWFPELFILQEVTHWLGLKGSGMIKG